MPTNTRCRSPSAAAQLAPALAASLPEARAPSRAGLESAWRPSPRPSKTAAIKAGKGSALFGHAAPLESGDGGGGDVRSLGGSVLCGSALHGGALGCSALRNRSLSLTPASRLRLYLAPGPLKWSH